MTGSPYGSAYGDATFDERMAERLLQFVRLGPNASGLVRAKSVRTELLLLAAASIRAAFDVTTATGDRLDRLGSILQLARNGADDDRYRVLLQIQIQLVLASQTSTPTIQRIVELYTGAPPLAYSEHYPMGYRIETAAGLTAAQVDELTGLLGLATAAAYEVALATASADALIVDDTAAAVSPATTIDSSAGTLVGAGTIAEVSSP